MSEQDVVANLRWNDYVSGLSTIFYSWFNASRWILIPVATITLVFYDYRQ